MKIIPNGLIIKTGRSKNTTTQNKVVNKISAEMENRTKIQKFYKIERKK